MNQSADGREEGGRGVTLKLLPAAFSFFPLGDREVTHHYKRAEKANKTKLKDK